MGLTVKQLIEKLKALPQDAKVYFPERGGSRVAIGVVDYDEKENEATVMP